MVAINSHEKSDSKYFKNVCVNAYLDFGSTVMTIADKYRQKLARLNVSKILQDLVEELPIR